MKGVGAALWFACLGWGRTAGSLVLVLTTLVGCEKKDPPDLHVQEGYRLLASDPQAAYDELSQARNASDPRVLLGRGLALERLRKYEEAERVLAGVKGAADATQAKLALGRVKIMLGKADEARPLIDAVVATNAADLSAVLLETCLAQDEKRARLALSHFDKWLDLARRQEGGASVPAEYYLARMSLFRQLKRRLEFETANEKAKGAKLDRKRGALALVQLALKAGRTDFATYLLRKLGEEAFLSEDKLQVAQLAHALGDHRLVGQLLQNLPGNDVALLSLRGEHEFVTGQPHAEVSLRRAFRASRDREARAKLWLMLAEALLREGDIEQARKEADQRQKKYPDERGVVLLARLDLAEGQPKAALERLAPLLTQTPVSGSARAVAAAVYVELGQPEKARPLLDVILKERPDDLRAAELRVAVEVESGRRKEAARVAEGLVSQAPDNVGLRLLLAEAERSAGGSGRAIQSLRKSIEALPREAPLYLSLVHELETSKQNAEALSVLESAHEKLPDSPMITAALAMKLSNSNQAKRAASLYEGLIEGAKGDPVALNNLAVLYVDELDNVERGVALAERAHGLSQEPAIVDTLGWALFRRNAPGDRKRAGQLLQSVKGKLTSPTSKYHLGAVLLATGKGDEGKGLLRQALAQSEGFAESEQARALLATEP